MLPFLKTANKPGTLKEKRNNVKAASYSETISQNNLRGSFEVMNR